MDDGAPGDTMEYLRTHPKAARRLEEALAAARAGEGRVMTMAEFRAFVRRVLRESKAARRSAPPLDPPAT